MDFNDPSLEVLPADRNVIFERLRRLSERLPEDVTNVELAPPSPVVGPNYYSEHHLNAVSPAILAQEPSPSLDSIAEENDNREENLISLPEASSLTNGNHEQSSEGEGEGVDALAIEEAGHSVEVPKSNGEHEETHLSDDKVDEPAIKVDESAPGPQADEHIEHEVPFANEVEDKGLEESAESSNVEAVQSTAEVDPSELAGNSDETEQSNMVEDKVADKPKDLEQTPLVEAPSDSGEIVGTNTKDIHAKIPPAPAAEIHGVQYTKSPAQSCNCPLDVGSCLEGPHVVPAPMTPFIVGNRQLGEDDDVREIATSEDSPSITVVPATPEASSKAKVDPLEEPVETVKTPAIEEENGQPLDTAKADDIEEENGRTLDTAKTTAIEEDNGPSQIKSRKQQSSPIPDRPLTPSSVRPSGKGAKSKNF